MARTKRQPHTAPAETQTVAPVHQQDIRDELDIAAMQEQLHVGPATEWADSKPKAWDSMTKAERAVEQWRKRHGLSHWVPAGK